MDMSFSKRGHTSNITKYDQQGILYYFFIKLIYITTNKLLAKKKIINYNTERLYKGGQNKWPIN